MTTPPINPTLTKITVHRLERYIQRVEICVDKTLPKQEQARQARSLVADGEGEEVGEVEYYDTDDSSNNWSVYNEEGKQIG